jgi:hypothetical protein
LASQEESGAGQVLEEAVQEQVAVGLEVAGRETWLHREEREDWKKRKRSSHQNSDTRQAPWTATLS